MSMTNLRLLIVAVGSTAWLACVKAPSHGDSAVAGLSRTGVSAVVEAADTIPAGFAWISRPESRDSVLVAVNARFMPATYDLVLDRNRPLGDDSVAAQKEVERDFPWDSVDQVTSARDSVSVLLRVMGRAEDAKYELRNAKSFTDSVKTVGEYFTDDRCLSWLVSLSVALAPDGVMTRTGQWKRYCHGGRPAFDRWVYVRSDTIVCTRTTAAGVDERPLCVEGLHEGKWLSARFAQDTLHLSQSCDGREVLIRRPETRAHGLVASRGPDMTTNRGC